MKETVILGFHGGHDGSLALVVNGKLIGALSKERLSRVKKDSNGNDELFIKNFLASYEYCIDDVTHVAFSELCADGYVPSYAGHKEPVNNFIKIYDGDREIFELNSRSDHEECVSLKALIGEKFVPAFYVQHHLAHSAYVFYTSPYKEAYCLSLDSTGGRAESTSLVCFGKGKNIKIEYCPNLWVSLLYEVFTEKLGFGSGLYKAGTIMGLASYGTPIKKLVDKWRDFTIGGLDKFYGDYWWYDEFWEEFSGQKNIFLDDEKDSKKAMDIAATVQVIFEKAILEVVRNIPGENICLSGGSFLNCNVNSLIKEVKSEVHVSPALGDDGLSAGCALYVCHNILGYDRVDYKNFELMYLGPEYDLSKLTLGKRYDVKEVASLLRENKIVAWYQGRSEFGPRALGNRCILASPLSLKVKDLLNSDIKGREWFRPFGPSVLIEKYKEWFDWCDESPFMLFTSSVKKPDVILGVTHVDNTSRIQTVSREDNFKYWELINEFDKLTGIAMLLNTSLNINGEPLVETPEDAMNFLKNTSVDALVLGDRIIFKKDLSS